MAVPRKRVSAPCTLWDCDQPCSAVLCCAVMVPAGFDGQLTGKMNVLRSCPVLYSCLSSRSDLKGLAYVAAAETFSWGSRVYSAGQTCQPGALYIIQEGSCKVSMGWSVPMCKAR
jgi:hypothetical protein